MYARRRKYNRQAAVQATGSTYQARRWGAQLEMSLRSEITIATDRDNTKYQMRCNPQSSSPFFSAEVSLPVELRDKIFDYALSQHEDDTQPYNSFNRTVYRPRYHARRRVYADLLLTCRRIWLEHGHVPMASTTHTFWFYDGPPSTARSAKQFHTYFFGMTTVNLANLNRVQLFTQSHWLETCIQPGMFTTMFSNPKFRPKVLTITLRHSDWLGSSQDDYPLRFDYSWVRHFLNSKYMTRVEQLEFEFETIPAKEEQLAEIVTRLKGTKTRMHPNEAPYNLNEPKRTGCQFKIQGKPLRSTWSGHNMEYVVYKLIWRRTPVTLPKGFKIKDPPEPDSVPTSRARRSALRQEKWLQQTGQVFDMQTTAYDADVDSNVSEHVAVHEPETHNKKKSSRGGKRSLGQIYHPWRKDVAAVDPDVQLKNKRAIWASDWDGKQSLLELVPFPTRREKEGAGF